MIEAAGTPDGRRFALVSLGCAKNTVDSEGIGQLHAHALVASVAPSDPATQSVSSYLRAHGWHGTRDGR